MNGPKEETFMHSSLQNLFLQEADRARKNSGSGKVLPEAAESADLDSYRAECGVIPKGAFKGITFDGLPREFKFVWGNESKCCVVALPFDDGGNMKEAMKIDGSWESFIENKKFLRLLSVMPGNKMTTGFPNMSTAPGRYFDLLPDEIKADVNAGGCTFSVEYKNSGDNREWFIGQCQKALENLKRLLGTGGAGDGSLN